MIYIFYFAAIYLVLYWVVPKGMPLYEGMRFPIWSFKMKMFPKKGLLPEKHSFGDHKRQYLIHYRPQIEETVQEHIVIYIHGGGWQFGNPEMFRPNAQLLNKLGYHSFFFSHRRIPMYNIRHMKEDVAMAMNEVSRIMKKEGIGSHRIILGGVSSGANLAALLYYDPKLLLKTGISKASFSGLFLLAPPLNLHDMWHSPTLKLLAGRKNGELFKEASPIDFIEEKEKIKTLILHPDKDGLVPFESTSIFYQRTQEMGIENIEFHVLENMTHMDAASWCFEGHPSKKIVMEWLANFDLVHKKDGSKLSS